MKKNSHKYHFGTLANQIRLDILRALRDGEKNVSELIAALKLNQSTVSHNLRRLTDSGFVRVRRASPFRYYSLNSAHVVSLLDDMEQALQFLGKKSEAALRESEARYSTLVELLPELVAVVSDGKFDFINAAGARMLGFTPEQIIGKPTQWFQTGPQASSRPEDPSVAEKAAAHMKAHGTFPPTTFNYTGPDGKVKAIEVLASPRVLDGKQSFLVLGRDVSEQRRLEEAVKKEQAHYKALLDAVPDMMLRIDRKGTILSFKPSEKGQVFTAADQFPGQDLYTALLVGAAAHIEAAMARVFDQGKTQVVEYPLANEDGMRQRFEARLISTGSDEVAVIIRNLG